MSWFLLHFWKVFSLTLLFSTWQISSHFLVAAVVADEKSCPWSHFSHLGNTFLSCCLQDFSLSLIFRSFIMMCFGAEFFGFILFGPCLASWICRLVVFCQIWENFSHCLFEDLSVPPSFQVSDDMNVASFVIVPQAPQALLLLFFLVFFPSC